MKETLRSHTFDGLSRSLLDQVDRRLKLGLQTNIGSYPSWLMKYYHAQALVTRCQVLRVHYHL